MSWQWWLWRCSWSWPSVGLSWYCKTKVYCEMGNASVMEPLLSWQLMRKIWKSVFYIEYSISDTTKSLMEPAESFEIINDYHAEMIVLKRPSLVQQICSRKDIYCTDRTNYLEDWSVKFKLILNHDQIQYLHPARIIIDHPWPWITAA